MASENMSLVPTQELASGSSAAQLLFHEDTNNSQALRFAQNRPIGGEPGAPKTRELSGFMDEKILTPVDREPYLASQGTGSVTTEEFRRSMYGSEVSERRGAIVPRNWNGNGATSTDSEGVESEGEDDEDDEDDQVEELDEGGKILTGHSKGCSSFGQPGSSLNRANTSESSQQRRIGHFPNEVNVAEPDGDLCYSQFMQSSDGVDHGQKDVACDNGCGYSGRKDSSTSSDPRDSLRSIFSDPVT